MGIKKLEEIRRRISDELMENFAFELNTVVNRKSMCNFVFDWLRFNHNISDDLKVIDKTGQDDVENGEVILKIKGEIDEVFVENNIHIADTEHSENVTRNSFRNIYTSLLTGLFSLDIRKSDSDPNENKKQAGPLTRSELSENMKKERNSNVYVSEPIDILYKSSYRHWKAMQLFEWHV